MLVKHSSVAGPISVSCGGCFEELPCTVVCDTVSSRRLMHTSTRRPKCRRKSAPKMANLTSAMVKNQPECSFQAQMKYQRALSTSGNGGGAGPPKRRCTRDMMLSCQGRHHTHIHTSIYEESRAAIMVGKEDRDRRRSVTSRTPVTLSASRGRFPHTCMAKCICGMRCHACGGTSKCFEVVAGVAQWHDGAMRERC